MFLKTASRKSPKSSMKEDLASMEAVELVKTGGGTRRRKATSRRCWRSIAKPAKEAILADWSGGGNVGESG